MSDAPDLPAEPTIDEPGQPPYVSAYVTDPPPDIPDEYPDPTPGGPEPPEWSRCERPSLTTDLANVLTLVDRVFVGQSAVRCEIKRVLGRYVDEELIRVEQLTADRLIVASMVRDAWGIPFSLRADCLEDSQAIDLVCGF